MNRNEPVLPSGGFADDSPVDEVDEQLVAYLDGELEPLERDALEARLGRDETLRVRLRQLQRGWDLLDVLPGIYPSPDLLESTIRMAATDGSAASASPSSAPRRPPSNRSGAIWLGLVTIAALGVGAIGARVWDRLRFHQQLRQLPVAMRVEGYLQGADLEWMRQLARLPAWQETVTIAERLGEWDFRLPQQIESTAAAERPALLRDLPIEDQQVVMEAWERFERLEPEQRRAVLQSHAEVSDVPDSGELLATMERYARWRESLPADTRDKIADLPLAERSDAVSEELKKSVRQWTQQSARLLTDQDVETIFQALREIAESRVQDALEDGSPLSESVTRAFARMDPRTEAFFLRELFRFFYPSGFRRGPTAGGPGGGPVDGEAARGSSIRPGAGVPNGNANADGTNADVSPASDDSRTDSGRSRTGGFGGGDGSNRIRFDFIAPALGHLMPLLNRVAGPLTDEELWHIESVLDDPVTDLLEAVSGIGTLREDLLRSWAEESLRRMNWNRSGTTLSERYELLDPARRDQLDLLKPEEILMWLRMDDGRRRSFP